MNIYSSPFFKKRVSDGGSSDEEFIHKISQIESDDPLDNKFADSDPNNLFDQKSACDDLCDSSRTSLKTDISLEFSESQSMSQSMSENNHIDDDVRQTSPISTEVSFKSSPLDSLQNDASSEDITSIPITNENSSEKFSHSAENNSTTLENDNSSKSNESTSISSSVLHVSPLSKSPIKPSQNVNELPKTPVKNPLLLAGCQWGKERTVEVHRVPDKTLGISIVGGKIDLFNMSINSPISGIFIKNVLPDSPAGASGALKTGDRILEVCIFL